jgi:aryl-alcohol dehydrogenase-like predicted oxidoreductase
MDYRQLGRSGLRVSTLTLGTMTIGGSGPSASVGSVDLDGARRQIDLCLDAGVNLIASRRRRSRWPTRSASRA